MHFRIGAVGWQYLSDLLLLMVDRKQIALTDPVSKWFGHYPYADLATVRMLAASSTGFGDYITPPAFAKEIYVNTRRVWTANDLVTRSLPPYQKPAFTDPGKNWAYSHTDFVMLGSILKQVGGKPYASLLQTMILDPLALHDTRLQFDDNPQRPALHTLDDETYRDTTFWNPSWVSWAAMTSNVCDLATWNRAFGTGSLLSPASKAEITAPVNVGLGRNAANVYFGLGTLVLGPWIVQRASYWGMYTSTAYDPTTGISLEVTTSLNPGSAPKQPSNDIISAMSRLLTPDHPIPN
jgi:CubicO group peptidase (beta-lactamase class C family)